MNNKEFIAELSAKNDLPVKDAQKMVSDIIGAMGDAFQEGEQVSIVNFGTFELKKRLERIVVNPSTKQRMLVPPKLTLNFKPSSSWKELIKSGGGE